MSGTHGIGGTPPGAALDQFLRDSYSVVQEVHANLDAIRAVANHLTPVEDLVEFQNEVTALHAKLGLLVAASELIVQATDAGIDLLLAVDAAAQRVLLGLKSAALQEASYFATATEFQALSLQVATLSDVVNGILVTLETKASKQELTDAIAPLLTRLTALETLTADTSRLDLIEQNLANGTYWDLLKQRTTAIETRLDDPSTGLMAQSNATQQLTTRVTQTEAGITALSQDVVNLTTRVSNAETGLSGETSARQALEARTSTLEGQVASQATAITQLQAEVVDADAQIAATGTALNTLTARVTATETTQLVQSADISQLDARVVNTEVGIAANGSAINTLQIEVQQTQDSLTIAGEDITALEASITGTGNSLPNSAFEVDLHGWILFSRGTGWLSEQLYRDLEPTRFPEGMHALCLANSGVPAGDAGIRSARIPVEPLSKQILSAWLAAENCTLRLEWRLFNTLGAEIGFGLVGQVTDMAPVTLLQNWPRQHALIPIPADAVTMEVQLWVTAAHVAAPKVWCLRPMLEQAVGSQSTPSPWTPSLVGIEEVLAGATQALTVRVAQTENLIDSQAGSVTDLVSRIGRLAEWRVVTHMGSGTYDTVGSPTPPQLSRAGDAPVHTFERGLTLVRFSVNGELASATRFDTFSNATERDNLRDALNALGPTDAFVLVAQDHHGIKQADLTAALEGCGAFNFANITGSRPYILLGRGLLGKGGGIEVYPLSSTPWLDFTFTLVNDTPKGLGQNNGLVDGLAGQATALSELTTRVTAAEGDITAISTSVTALDARLETAETALVQEMITSANKNAALVATTNQLTADLDVVEAAVTAHGSAISTLQTQMTAAEGTISSHSSSLTSLQTQVDAMDTNTGGFGSAIAALDTRVDQTEADIASHSSAITALQSSVTNANKIYAQAAAPATAGGRDGDLWFDTDDGNKPYVLSGSQWIARQDLNKNTIFVQANQPTALALNDLWIETDNSNKPWRWNGTTWVDASDARITANASAITTLQTRATAIEGVNTSQASAITALENTVNSPTTGVNATATGLSSLTTRVTAAENNISSQASSITSISASLFGGRPNLIFNSSGQYGTDGWGSSGSPGQTVLNAPDGLQFRYAANATAATKYAYFDFTPGAAGAYTFAVDVYANTGATGTFYIDIVCYDAGGAVLLDGANQIFTADSTWKRVATTITAPTNTAKVRARVICSGATWTTFAFRRAKLEFGNSATPYSEEGSAVQSATATQALAVRVDATETGLVTLNAKWSVTLDVNGYVSGLQSVNNGTKADFTILADSFWLVAPGKTKRKLFGVDSTGVYTAGDLYVNTGRIIVDTGTHMKVTGKGFGTANQFVEWYGPKMAITSCSEANAITYIKTNGDAYFGGSLSAGILRNSVSSSSTVMVGNEVVNGPFNTNGNTKNVVVSYSRTWSRSYSGMSSSGYVAGSGSNTATIQIYRKIGTAAETLWYTLNCGGNVDIMNEFDGPDGAVLTWGGSVTLSDSDPSTANRTYRAVITAATTQSVTRNDGNGDTSSTTTARLTIISTEE